MGCKLIHVGSRYAAAQARVIDIDRLVHIYHGDALIRALTIDPNRYYQPKGGREPPRRRSVTKVPSTTCHTSSRQEHSNSLLWN